MSLLYCDSSALVKLVREEAESAALRTFINECSQGPGLTIASSALSHTEVLRAVSRSSQASVADAKRMLEGITLIDISPEVLERAGLLTPVALRSLDAIHLASVLPESAGLIAVVTDDPRMSQAAREVGLPVASPGMAA